MGRLNERVTDRSWVIQGENPKLNLNQPSEPHRRWIRSAHYGGMDEKMKAVTGLILAANTVSTEGVTAP